MIDEKKLISHIEKQYREWGEKYDAMQILGDIEDFPKVGKWIPVEERLPDKDGEYLVYYVEDEERCAFADKEGCEVIRFDADLKAFGFWVDIFDYQILAYSDRKFDEFYGVVAWMPLPEPYKKD